MNRFKIFGMIAGKSVAHARTYRVAATMQPTSCRALSTAATSAVGGAADTQKANRRQLIQQRALSLRDFTLRTQILSLYRRYIRAVRQLPRHAIPATQQHIQTAFRQHGTLEDPKTKLTLTDKRALLSDGERQLKYLSSYVSTAADNPMFEGIPAAPTDGSMSQLHVDGDDVRGRIGEQWPWE